MRIGKIGIAFLHSVCIGAACAIDVTTGGTATATVALSTPLLKTAKDIFTGTSSQALINQLDKIIKGKDLTEVYNKTLLKSFELVKADFIESEEIGNISWEKLKRDFTGLSTIKLTKFELLDSLFFNPLIKLLNDEKALLDILSNHREVQIHELISELILSDSSVQFPKFLKNKEDQKAILDRFSESFTLLFLVQFDAELSQNELAQTRYQNEILRTLSDEVGYIANAVRKKSIPPLTLHTKPNTFGSELDFSYKNAKTVFVGREYELKKLNEFLHKEDPFQWLMISGSGGSGKSRLALHVGIKASENGWYAGFLDHLDYDFELLNPKRHLLIFIDYAKMRDIEQLKKMFKSLSRYSQSNLNGKKVRVVLFERFFDEEFLKDVTSTIPKDFYFLKEGKITPLELQALNDSSRWKIIKQMIEESEVLSNDQKTSFYAQEKLLIEELDKIDSEHRPLFAFIYGYAISVGEKDKIGTLTVNNALSYVIDRLEITYWNNLSTKYSIPKETVKTFAMVAALCEEISFDKIAELLDKDEDRTRSKRFFKVPGTFDPDELLKPLLGVSPNNSEKLVYQGMKPDLIAEYLILSHLEHLRAKYTEQVCIEMLNQIWTLQPEGVSNMIFLTHQNFYEDKRFNIIEQFLDQLTPQDSTSLLFSFFLVSKIGSTLFYNDLEANNLINFHNKCRNVRSDNEFLSQDAGVAQQCAKAVLALSAVLSKSENLKAAQSIYAQIIALREEQNGLFAQDQEIALQQAKAAYNLALDWSNAGHPETAQSFYTQIIALREEHNELFAQDQEIALWQTKAAYNLALAWGIAGHPETAQSIYTQIIALREEQNGLFAQDQEIALWQAKAALNLALDWGNAGHPETAQSFYTQIIALREEHNELFAQDQDIALQQAKAAYNLALDWGNAGHPETAQSFYTQIIALREEHNELFAQDQEIALWQAKAALNLALAWGNAGHPETAQSFYTQIIALREEHNGLFAQDQEIALWQAKAAYNLALAWGIAGHPETAQSIYPQIIALREEHNELFAQDQEIALQQAKAAYNLALAWGIAGHPETAQSIYTQIIALREEHNELFAQDQEIALWQAKAALNLALAWGIAGHPETAQSIYTQIIALREEQNGLFAQDQEIALQQAKAAFNLALAWGIAGHPKTAQSIYTQIIALREEQNGLFAQDQEIALQQAKAALNLALAWGIAGHPETAQSIYTQIIALREEQNGLFAQDQEIALQQAKAALNLALAWGNAGHPETAQSFYTQIIALREEHNELFAQDQEIALWQAKAALNLALAWGIAGHPETAQSIYTQIIALREEQNGLFAQDQEIALQQAKAAFNLALAWGNAGHPETAQSIYSQIIALREEHNELFAQDQEIALQQAKAALNLALAWGIAGHPETAQSIYTQIIALREEHNELFAQDQEIALQQAKAAYNLALHWPKESNKTKKIQAIIKQTTNIVDSNKGEALITTHAQIGMLYVYYAAHLIDTGEQGFSEINTSLNKAIEIYEPFSSTSEMEELGDKINLIKEYISNNFKTQ